MADIKFDKFIRNYTFLCYHRIVTDFPEATYPEDGLSLSSSEFEKQLIYFRKNFDLVNLKDPQTADKRNSADKIVITFDDGYGDIIRNVMPIVEKLKIPIVVFITTGPIENNTEFCWWEDLWRDLTVGEETIFNINGHSISFNLESYRQKMNCYKYLSGILINLKRKDQLAFFKDNGLKINNIKEFLTVDDVKRLSSHPLVTFGFHSNYHLNYNIESQQDINDDIEKMFIFYKKYLNFTYAKLFAFCYGIYSRDFFSCEYSSMFDHYFALGFKALINKDYLPVTSRIIVNSKKSLIDLRLKICFFRLFRRIVSIL